MNVLENFLKVEVDTQEMYDEIIHFVTSPNIRNGEFEMNEHVIQKRGFGNFIIFIEYSDQKGRNYVHRAEAIGFRQLVDEMNAYAMTQNIETKTIDRADDTYYW